MKKIFLVIPTILLSTPLLFSCSSQEAGVTFLKVLNSEDYINEGLLLDFENQMASEGKKVKIVYDTFDTMENMFNTLKTGKTTYDVVCASEYMIQKLYSNSLLTKLDYHQIQNYDTLCSKFIREKLANVKLKDNENLDQYCNCYMWGTAGITYNPNYYVFRERKIDSATVINDMNDWNSLWNEKYNKTISIKDSMRDTYAIGLIHHYQNELMDESKSYEEKTTIFNYGGEDDPDAINHINIVKDELNSLKENIFGFEVDSGKDDIVTGKIGIDTAWSGDAIYSMNAADEAGKKLYYALPKQGANMWFDCWSLLKSSENPDIAYRFLDYIAKPESAIKNMEKIHYSSSIATKETFDYFNTLYQVNDESGIPYDLSYFFGEGHTITVNPDKIERQLKAQFPPIEYSNHLFVMKDYGKNNDLILKMWQEVKHEPLPTWALALFIVEIAAAATFISLFIGLGVRNKKRRRLRRLKTVKTNIN